MSDPVDHFARRLGYSAVWWLLAVGTYFVGPVSNDNAPEITPLLGTAFVGLSLTWNGRSVPRRWFWVMVAAYALSASLLGALLSGTSISESTQITSGTLAGSIVMVVVWGSRGGGTQRPPRDVWDLIWLLVAAIIGTLTTALLGGWRHMGYLAVTQPEHFWLIVRCVVSSVVIGVLFLIFYYGDTARWRTQPRPAWWVVVLTPFVLLTCVSLPFIRPSLPLTWLMLVPALWAGLLFTPRWTAVHSMAMALCAVGLTALPIEQFSDDGFIPPSYVIDVLMGSSILLSILLSLMRDQRDQALAVAIHDRRQYDEQASVMSLAFDAVSDGIVVLDQASGVVMTNPAARIFLGWKDQHVSGAGDRGLDWNGEAEFHTLAGEVVSADTLITSPLATQTLSVTVAGRESHRIVTLRRFPISATRVMLLLSDVTAERTRVEELSKFSRVVAHDLRSPLSNLTGWVELAKETAEDEQEDEVLALLVRATTSGTRMAHSIDDWLHRALPDGPQQ